MNVDGSGIILVAGFCQGRREFGSYGGWSTGSQKSSQEQEKEPPEIAMGFLHLMKTFPDKLFLVTG